MKLVRIAVTGAGGQIAYSLLFSLARGGLLGEETPIALHLMDLPEMEPVLQGVRMELEDGGFPCLREIRVGSDPYALFEDVEYAFLLGGKPRSAGMERKDLLEANGHIFVEQGRALNRVAHRNVYVLVVANPCNTNCLIAQSQAPDLPVDHFHAMTRLDQNRASFQLAQKASVPLSEVERMTIWGNHSLSQVPDFVNAKIANRSVCEVIADRAWLEGEFSRIVQQRGGAVLKARGKSSAASAASAALSAMKEFITPTTPENWFSSAFLGQGNPYAIDPELVFSYPCHQTKKGPRVVFGLQIDSFLEEKIRLSEAELKEERDLVAHLLVRKLGGIHAHRHSL